MPNFWKELNKPIFALAPMADVTDVAFREMFARYSGQDPRTKIQEPKGNGFVMFTEFVNVDGLTHPEGYKRLAQDLKFTEIQRPIVAQIWGRNPEKFYEAAQIISKLGFDGIDINFGCPQDKEIGQKTCAALILEPELAKQIISATKKGAGGLPVSVKTRLGYSKASELEVWLKHLLQAEPAAITLHARTKQEKSKVPAQWGSIAEAVKIRDEAISSKKGLPRPSDALGTRNDRTLIIGNGDIKSREEGLSRISETGCDGVMIGRGAFGNPWFFRQTSTPTLAVGAPTSALPSVGVNERLSVMLEHAQLFEKEFSGIKSFAIMRKHFKAYASGFDGANELRVKLMETKNLEETKKIVEEYLKDID